MHVADRWSQVLSQPGAPRTSFRQGIIVALATAAGFGVGYGVYYFKYKPLDNPHDHDAALAVGAFFAMGAGGLPWVCVR